MKTENVIFADRMLFAEFCKWSKVAEWRDGTKQMYIKNDWNAYINTFFEDREKATEEVLRADMKAAAETYKKSQE